MAGAGGGPPPPGAHDRGTTAGDLDPIAQRILQVVRLAGHKQTAPLSVDDAAATPAAPAKHPTDCGGQSRTKRDQTTIGAITVTAAP